MNILKREQTNSLAAALCLDYEALIRTARRLTEQFLKNSPYPHIAIDNFLPEDLLEKVISEFPPPHTKLDWRRHYVENKEEGFVAQEGKLGFSDELKMSTTIRNLMREFRSADFLVFLEELTGVKQLLGDPYLLGAGIHQTMKGGLVGIHADFSTHSKLPLERRVNAILFLNKNWSDEWGGHLELWSRDMSACEVRIAPIANRMVIFLPTRDTWHGHPHPLSCPANVTRKSLANFYYTVDRPVNLGPRHGTIWRKVD